MIAASLILLFQAVAADPLEPAWRGQVQCYAPDLAQKACASIGAYARDPGGAIRNKAVVLLSASPPIVMTTTAPVQVKAGAVCGVIRMGDIDAASFELGGQSAAPDAAASIRKAIAPGYQAIVDREICTTYVPDGDALKAQVTVDGKRRPEMDMAVRWVAPEAGFSVKP